MQWRRSLPAQIPLQRGSRGAGPFYGILQLLLRAIELVAPVPNLMALVEVDAPRIPRPLLGQVVRHLETLVVAWLSKGNEDTAHTNQDRPRKGNCRNVRCVKAQWERERVSERAKTGICDADSAPRERPVLPHQRTKPRVIQKWHRQSLSCRTDGETLGRPSQSRRTCQCGLRFGDRES